MLTIKCITCQAQFHVKGYIIPASWEEPSETVTDLEPVYDDEPLCEHLLEGGEYEITGEDHPTFDDDVI